MDIQSQLLFFFSALGAFNGLLIGMYFLFYAKPRHKSHRFLGLLLLALSVRVGKSVFYYFVYNLADVYIQLGLFACWFIGPLCYFYIKSALEVDHKINKELKIHFAFLIPIALVLFLAFPRSTYEDLWGSWFIQFIYVQWIVYLIAAGYIIWKNYYKIRNAKKGMPSFKLWLLSIYFGNLIICIAFNTGYYTSYIVGALSFSFLFYLLGLLLLFAKKRNELLFLNVPRKREKRISSQNALLLIKKLDKLMGEDELFRDANLTMPKVANSLKILPNKLSLLLNDNMNVSFSNYLNEKRILAAQNSIRENLNLSFETIGYDCGFNSKSAFYAAFRKHAGTTPAQFRKSIIDRSA